MTAQFSGSCEEEPLEVYSRLRKNNPAPYSALLMYASAKRTYAICCSSPERYLRVQEDSVADSKPIKGTLRRKRNSSLADDAASAESLRTDVKSR